MKLIVKRKKMVKSVLCILFVILLTASSFASVVSDNDGSAFITKAEFDSLKNDFQSQIDSYNSSIDSKIDGAIASYLSGIRVSKKTQFKLDENAGYVMPMYMDTGDNKWNDPNSKYYDLSIPRVEARKIELWDESYYKPNTKWMVSTTDGKITAGNAGNNVSNTARYGCVEKKWTYDGIVGHINIVKNSSWYRNISGTDYQCYDRDSFGRYRLNIWYNPDIVYGVGLVDGGPYSGNTSNVYHYTDLMGFNNPRGSSGTSTTWDFSNKSAWTPSRFYGSCHGTSSSFSSGSGAKITESNFTKYSSINWNGGWIHSTDYGSPNVKVEYWEGMGKTHWVYAKNANSQACASQRWNYIPFVDSTLLANTKIAKGFITNDGYKYNVLVNWSGGNFSAYNFVAHLYTAIPYWLANTNSTYRPTISTNFSQLPASLITYTDEKGKQHFLDEGFYLITMEKKGTCEFAVKFGTDTGNKTLKFYASKKPFTSSITPSDYIQWTVGDVTTNYMSMTTGLEYKLTIKDLEKDDQIYLYWEPDTAGEYIYLDNIYDMYWTTEE